MFVWLRKTFESDLKMCFSHCQCKRRRVDFFFCPLFLLHDIAVNLNGHKHKT